MWLPKVTKLEQSKSGDLYLASQMARYGLCLGPLQFRLQCILLREVGAVDLEQDSVQVKSRSTSWF